MRLNHERAAEEAAGHVRYLRPAYQNKSFNSYHLTFNKELDPKAAELLNDNCQLLNVIPFPKGLAPQMQAVRDAVQQAAQPLTAAEVAARFERTKPATVQPLLDTLAALSLLRRTAEGGYAA